MNIAIAVASRHGSTHEIAEALAEGLRGVGHTVAVQTIDDTTTLSAPEAVIIGSAILESNLSAPLDYTAQRYLVVIRTEITPPWVDAGQPVTVTFVVMPGLVVPLMPTGVVTVRDGDAAPVCSVFVSSAGSCTFTPAGRFPIRIDYSGDDHFAPGTTSWPTAVRLATHIVVAATPNPVRAHQVLTLTAYLSSDGIACGYFCPPIGEVRYYDNGIYLASTSVHPRVGAVFPITVTLATLGSHIITGSYVGNVNYAGCTSSPLTVQVTPHAQFFPLVEP